MIKCKAYKVIILENNRLLVLEQRLVFKAVIIMKKGIMENARL